MPNRGDLKCGHSFAGVDALSSGATILLVLALASAAATASPKPFSIDAEEAPRSLLEFGRQSAVQILFASEKVKGIVTNAVHGNYEPIEALRLLLKGTPLVVSEKADGVLVVEPKSDAHHVSDLAPLPAEDSANAERLAQSAATGAHSQPVSGNPNGATGPSSVSGASDKTALTEIVVTAQKRVERLIDTPQSVSVITASDIAKLGATQFSDFANTVPGLTFQTLGAGYTQVTLRGVTAGVDISPTVGIYVDDVPYGSSAAFALAAQLSLDVGLFDLNRIEVLRGPQGTLYGASTMGGLIKYVTTPPDANNFGGDVQVGVSGTYDGSVNYNVAGAVNLPLVADTMALRVSGYESHDGGYIDNVALDQRDVNHSDIYGGRVDFLLKPTDQLSMRIGAFVQDISRNGQSTTDYSFTGMETYGSLGQYRLLEEPFEQHFTLVSGTVNYNFGLATLTSITSYQEPITRQLQDFSAEYVPLLALFGLRYGAVGAQYEASTDKFTEEVRLASNGTQTLDWLVGGFYTHETSDTSVNFVLRDVAGQPAPNTLFAFDEMSRYVEYAAFGDLTWHFTSKFDVTGGIRYARNEQKYTQVGSGLLATSVPTSGSNQDVSTYLGDARYHFTDHATGYLRYATGYRPGGPNPQLLNPITGHPIGPATFQPDKLKSYEAGFKAETADRRFGFDLAAYYLDWSNIQVAIIENGFGARANVPSGAGIRGGELGLNARPISPLTLTGTFAYQSTYLRQADPVLGAVAGEPLPNVPRATATFSGDYALYEGGLQPTVGATVRYIDARWASWVDSVSNPQYHIPDYTTVDLRTGLTVDKVSLQLYVHNLFDERAQLSAYTQLGTAQVAIMQPRTIGITASAHF